MRPEGVCESGWGVVGREYDFKKVIWATLVAFRIIFKQFMTPVKIVILNI